MATLFPDAHLDYHLEYIISHLELLTDYKCRLGIQYHERTAWLYNIYRKSQELSDGSANSNSSVKDVLSHSGIMGQEHSHWHHHQMQKMCLCRLASCPVLCSLHSSINPLYTIRDLLLDQLHIFSSHLPQSHLPSYPLLLQHQSNIAQSAALSLTRQGHWRQKVSQQ